MSVFLAIDHGEWIASNELAFAIRDRFPVSPGHSLVVPKRYMAEWWDATDIEKQAIWSLVEVVKRRLDAEYAPDGYNVGFNSGTAAGQTVDHLHVHVIPRYRGDVSDPRRGPSRDPRARQLSGARGTNRAVTTGVGHAVRRPTQA